MPPQETGKQRATRIPLNYYKTPDLLERWKLLLGGLAVVAALAWLGTNLVVSDQRDFHASRGPVAAVHQSWDTQCSACHVDFTPISSHSWSAPFLPASVKESSARCQVCHQGAVHHADMQPEMSCAACHREHRGRDASLVNLPDSDCTQCHQDLSKHIAMTASKAEFANDVTRFAEGTHPDFRSIKSDPGKLKFNHRLHLTPGMAIEKNGVKGGPLKMNGKEPVQLQCASCHQLGTDRPNKQANSGAYMLPISYEKHCQECHPLTVERKVPGDAKSEYLTIPHRLAPKEIHDLLKNFYIARSAQGIAGFLQEKRVRPLPGKSVESLLPASIKEDVEKQLRHEEKKLYLSNQACAECHYFETGTLRMAPTNVPQVWFQHAKFNHSAHQAVKCADCHAGAETSTSHSDVLIPDQKNCVQCHAPTTKIGTPGVRFNCTECHRYHHGEPAPQRRGVEAFLEGK